MRFSRIYKIKTGRIGDHMDALRTGYMMTTSQNASKTCAYIKGYTMLRMQIQRIRSVVARPLNWTVSGSAKITVPVGCHYFQHSSIYNHSVRYPSSRPWPMMTSSNGNIFRVTGPLCRASTGHRWIPLTKASDAEFWCFLWSAPEQTSELTIEALVIWDAIVVIMTSL